MFRRLAWAIDYVKPLLKSQLVEELGSMADNCEDVDELMHLRAAIDVCREHELHCHGADQQYESTQACIDHIYRKIPVGKVYEWGGDNGKPSLITPVTFCAHNTTHTQPCADTFTKVTPSTGHRRFAFSAHPPSGMLAYRPTVHCPHVGYAILNMVSLYIDPNNSPSGGGMCIKRDVCIPSRSRPSIALIYLISISPRQPRSCTRFPSCRWHWVRCLRHSPPLSTPREA